MVDSPITKARIAEKTLRLLFEAEKEREWQTVSASARTDVERAVWKAHQSGTSISAICRDYGTKHRDTIYGIIKRMTALESLGMERPGTMAVTHDTGAVEDGYPDPFRVFVTDWTFGEHPAYTGFVSFFVRPTGSVYIIEAEHPGSPLHTEILAWQDDSPFIAQVKAQMIES